MSNLLMNRKQIVAFTLLLTLVVSIDSKFLHSYASSMQGKICYQVGSFFLSSDGLLKCDIKNGRKTWTLTKDEFAKLKPFPLTGPSWLDINKEQLAIEKANYEKYAREVAERQATAEKAKLEAEKEAKRLESQKPNIQGLEIGALLWADDFRGKTRSQIDSKYWTARNCHRVPNSFGGGACFDSEVMHYAPSQIALDGSEAGAVIISTNRVSGILPADAGPCLTNYCPFISGRFDTHGKVSFQYGYIEARIKMPEGSGNHPAFWMLGDNINEVGWPASGEMDIIEVRGNQPTIATSATHYSTTNIANSCCSNHQYKVAALQLGVDLSSDFHLYAIAWLPNSISYYVDGKLISTTTPQNLGGYWHFNEKFFLILNNAVNAGFSGSWADLTSSTMVIDWVRSYQLNGQGSVFVK